MKEFQGNSDVLSFTLRILMFNGVAIKIESRKVASHTDSAESKENDINHETLFPGIGGFCQSLYIQLGLLASS